ncbi:HNH endonuclease signature motif containing protein [Streptomyces sp. NPDC006307]|uniref:HNH endonuclease signature motif containing protein n=1 Tax=Streptomyces sp. NPDC006307 TaxID=3156748 RepID=UPI0033A0E689
MSGRRGGDALFPRDQLVRAVAESYSVAGVLRRLGQANGGAARARVKRSIQAYEVSTAHFVGQGHQAGRPSRTRKTAADILRHSSPGSPRTKTVQLRRALDELGVPHRCQACGTGDVWQGKRLVLEIDHINGDRLDNRLENLRYLCPSCHSQTRNHSTQSRRTAASTGQ